MHSPRPVCLQCKWGTSLGSSPGLKAISYIPILLRLSVCSYRYSPNAIAADSIVYIIIPSRVLDKVEFPKRLYWIYIYIYVKSIRYYIYILVIKLLLYIIYIVPALLITRFSYRLCVAVVAQRRRIHGMWEEIGLLEGEYFILTI